tara:strand:- start:1322 stop:1513 length:192 start_codon:yes stop_codon:yes gene_type:complete
MEKKSKEEIVIELLEIEEITPEEAATLLDKEGTMEIVRTYELINVKPSENEKSDSYWTTNTTG